MATDTFSHTEAFTHRRFYTQTLLHTEAFTHRSSYTQKLCSNKWDGRAQPSSNQIACFYGYRCVARFVVYVHSLCGHAWGMVRTGTAAAGVLRLRGAAAPGRTAQRKNFQRTSTRLFAAVFFCLESWVPWRNWTSTGMHPTFDGAGHWGSSGVACHWMGLANRKQEGKESLKRQRSSIRWQPIPLVTQKLLHTDAFTHRRFYTQKLSHTEALTHRSYVATSEMAERNHRRTR